MIDRLFQIVYLLMEKPKMSAKELADIFEVSVRTIYRDLDKLTLAGIPVYTHQGKNGGISILEGYVLDKSVLTRDEKNKIMESLNALNETLSIEDKTMDKLHSFFGNQRYDWIEIDFSSWGNEQRDAEIFELVKNAILNRNYMEIVYSGSRGGLIERKIKPMKLCFKNQAWYLYAYCCLRKDYRFFKLHRIIEINVLKNHFEFEKVGKVLSESGKKYADQHESMKVIFEISQEMGFRAFEELRDVTVNEEGKILCQMEVKDIEGFIGYILSFGSCVRVLEPLELRERIVQEIHKMNHVYE